MAKTQQSGSSPLQPESDDSDLTSPSAPPMDKAQLTLHTPSSGSSFEYLPPSDTEWKPAEEPNDSPPGREPITAALKAPLGLDHLSILIGSGASISAGGPSMQGLWEKSKEALGETVWAELLKKLNLKSDGGDIEELLSRCDASIRLQPDSDALVGNRDKIIQAIHKECGAASLLTDADPRIRLLTALARRRSRDARMKVFTTNYDTLIEKAAAEKGLIPIDGFSFTYPREFNSQFLNYDIVHREDESSFVPGVFQLIKLHGSIDWRRNVGRKVIQTTVEHKPEEACIIYPAQTKFAMAFESPYLELLSHYISALNVRNHCFVTIGFGFNDDHLTGPLLNALATNSSFRLIVVDFKAKANQADPPNSAWKRLVTLQKHGADVMLVNGTFEQFAKALPSFTSLSPSEELASRIVGAMNSESNQ